MNRMRYIKAGCFIDGSGGPVQKNIFLTVKDGFIIAINLAAELPDDAGAVTDDLSKCTIVPALVDCSLSLTRSPSVDLKVRREFAEAGSARKAALAAQHVSYCHAHGVLGVADNHDDIGLKDQLPKILEQNSNIDIRTAGRDFLRIVYSSIVSHDAPPGSRLNYDDLMSMLPRKGDKKVVVVANGEQQVKEALAAGCDAIEQGYDMGEDNLRKMAETGVLWIPSVLLAKNSLDGVASGGEVMCRFSMRYTAPGKPDPGAEAYWKRMLAAQLAQLQLAKKLEVSTAIGTGAGSVGILHGESVVEEIKLFIKAGWSLEQAIRCASDRGARFFNLRHPGVLAVGQKATFLVARGTVQQLPRKLAYLENVYVEGQKTY